MAPIHRWYMISRSEVDAQTSQRVTANTNGETDNQINHTLLKICTIFCGQTAVLIATFDS